MVSLMRAPHTYTREDVVEINCHSGYGVLRRILDLALAAGARLARPGEFTLRAFLSGRLDLTQAEAVLEVIRARTETHLQVAAAHLHGGLGRRLKAMRQDLLDLLARVEAALDFPEEAGELDPGLGPGEAGPARGSLQAMADSYEAGRLLREGLLVVIAGRPNVGKSSLLNRLLDMERAIVTEIPGTTRDLVEESITLKGVVVRFSDTAGLRPAQDRVEELGIERTRERLRQADLVLYLVDVSHPLAPEDGRPWRWPGAGAVGQQNGCPVSEVLQYAGPYENLRQDRPGHRGLEGGNRGPGVGRRSQGGRRGHHPGPPPPASPAMPDVSGPGPGAVGRL
jgi:tRNA modification GTPase